MKGLRRDGNDPFNEAFGFASLTAFRAFMERHPDLFDRELDTGERRRRWIEFAGSVEGQALRWR